MPDYTIEYWGFDDPNTYYYYETDDPAEAEAVEEQLTADGFIWGYIRKNGEDVYWCASEEALSKFTEGA